MCYLSAKQQLLNGCDNAAEVGGPGSSTWHKLSRGIYQPVGGKAADSQITLDGALLFTGQIVVDGSGSLERPRQYRVH